MIANTQMLDEYIDASGYKIKYLVDILGISRQAFDQKRKGVIPFRPAEVYVLCDMLKIPKVDEKKIFTKKVQ